MECEPAIKSIIVHLDSENHDFIIEDLDEQRLVVKENMVQLLKQKLEDVGVPNGHAATLPAWFTDLLCSVSRRPTDQKSPSPTRTEQPSSRRHKKRRTQACDLLALLEWMGFSALMPWRRLPLDSILLPSMLYHKSQPTGSGIVTIYAVHRVEQNGLIRPQPFQTTP